VASYRNKMGVMSTFGRKDDREGQGIRIVTQKPQEPPQKKQDSIWCPQCKGTNAETLKWQRSVGEGDQELEKRLVREELF
jgi:hypothetical protein